MKMKTILNVSALAALTLIASSCIQVDNVEKAWNDSKADPALLGAWDDGKGGSCAFVKTEKDYFVTSGTNGLEGCCKSFDADGSKYVIVASLKASVLGFDKQEADAKDGTLLRYEVKGDKLSMYSLDGNVLKKAVEAKEVPGTIEDDSAKLNELDEATIKWLGKVAKGNGWKETVYKRVR